MLFSDLSINVRILLSRGRRSFTMSIPEIDSAIKLYEDTISALDDDPLKSRKTFLSCSIVYDKALQAAYTKILTLWPPVGEEAPQERQVLQALTEWIFNTDILTHSAKYPTGFSWEAYANLALAGQEELAKTLLSETMQQSVQMRMGWQLLHLRNIARQFAIHHRYLVDVNSWRA